MQDEQLAAAAAGGDQDAFGRLVDRYRPYIYTIAWRIVLDEDDALDVTQNVLLRLVERIGDFNGSGPFRAWLATIAAREAVNIVRHRSRREMATDPEILEQMSDGRAEERGRSRTEDLETEDRRRLVHEAMKRLSPQQRAILALRLGEEMPPREIAEQLGLPPRQVRSQLCTAIKKVREALKQKHD